MAAYTPSPGSGYRLIWETKTPQDVLNELENAVNDPAQQHPVNSEWTYVPKTYTTLFEQAKMITYEASARHISQAVQSILNQKIEPTGKKLIIGYIDLKLGSIPIAPSFLFQFVPDVLDDQDLDVLGI